MCYNQQLFMTRTELLNRYNQAEFKEAGVCLEYNRDVLWRYGFILKDTFSDPVVLDLASGTGGAADYLESEFGMQAVRLDISGYALDLSKGKRVRAIAQNLPFKDSSFEGIHMKDAIVHIENKDHIFGEIARVLKPNGMAILTSAYFESAGVFTHSDRFSEFKRCITIGNESDYLREVSLLNRRRRSAKISPPYFRCLPSEIERSANLNGLRLVSRNLWTPDCGNDWYDRAPKPVERFVMILDKSEI